MHRHVRIVHRAPPQTSQKQGRHREVSEKHKNSTKSAPRQRPGTPTRASGVPQGTQKEASRAQKTPQKEYSGAPAAPKSSKTHTLDVSERKDKTTPKLHNESRRAPKERPVRPVGAQERSKRGPKGRQGHPRGSIVAPGPPKTAPKWRSGGERKSVLKAAAYKNWRNSILHIIYHTSRTSATPKIITFSSHLGSKIDAKTDPRTRHPKKTPKMHTEGTKMSTIELQESAGTVRPGPREPQRAPKRPQESRNSSQK